MEDRVHYLCRVQLNGFVVFVVWYSGERDGFVRDAAGRLRAACTPEALTATAGIGDVLFGSEEPADYDFDRIRAWCAAPDQAGIDFAAFLNTWNFLDDLAGLPEGAEAPYTRLSRDAAACYDKLFWGSNLPAVTPPGERFEPEWRANALAEVQMVLEAGLDLLESELRAAGTAPNGL